MNLRESRVLAAVQRLGAATSLEVAEACRYSTTEARAVLRDLAEQGRIRQDGRRWIVPSLALAQDTEEEAAESDTGNALFACGLVVIVVAVLIAIFFAIKGLLHG